MRGNGTRYEIIAMDHVFQDMLFHFILFFLSSPKAIEFYYLVCRIISHPSDTYNYHFYYFYLIRQNCRINRPCTWQSEDR